MNDTRLAAIFGCDGLVEDDVDLPVLGLEDGSKSAVVDRAEDPRQHLSVRRGVVLVGTRAWPCLVSRGELAHRPLGY